MSNSDAAKFEPKSDEELPPIGDLLERGEVTAEDIEQAITKWKDNPPIDGYENILEAEEL